MNLIPHTLAATNLGALDGGARVNLEADMLARYVERLLEFGAQLICAISAISHRHTRRSSPTSRAGRMVVLVDEEDRENEGDLLLAADFVTPEAINFMARYGRGLICLTLTEEQCRQLNLPLMVVEQSIAARHQFHGVDRGRRTG